jgi:hypothetical protein
MCSRNAQKVSLRYNQSLKSRKYALHGKEDASPRQIITKNILMTIIKPRHVDRPSNHVRNISKSDEKGGFSGISSMTCVEDVHVGVHAHFPYFPTIQGDY